MKCLTSAGVNMQNIKSLVYDVGTAALADDNM